MIVFRVSMFGLNLWEIYKNVESRGGILCGDSRCCVVGL